MRAMRTRRIMPVLSDLDGGPRSIPEKNSTRKCVETIRNKHHLLPSVPASVHGVQNSLQIQGKWRKWDIESCRVTHKICKKTCWETWWYGPQSLTAHRMNCINQVLKSYHYPVAPKKTSTRGPALKNSNKHQQAIKKQPGIPQTISWDAEWNVSPNWMKGLKISKIAPSGACSRRHQNEHTILLGSRCKRGVLLWWRPVTRPSHRTLMFLKETMIKTKSQYHIVLQYTPIQHDLLTNWHIHIADETLHLALVCAIWASSPVQLENKNGDWIRGDHAVEPPLTASNSIETIITCGAALC